MVGGYGSEDFEEYYDGDDEPGYEFDINLPSLIRAVAVMSALIILAGPTQRFLSFLQTVIPWQVYGR
jgi:hypothetical protein